MNRIPKIYPTKPNKFKEEGGEEYVVGCALHDWHTWRVSSAHCSMLIQHLPLFLPLTSSFLTTTTMFFSQPFSSSPTFPLRFRCTTFKLNKPFTVVASDRFPPFLPNEIHTVKDPFARKFAMRIQRLPVPVINYYTLSFSLSLFFLLKIKNYDITQKY